ncbi:uncharacterized protein PODANS_6_765 [Podospora anserina S mat+]|uniref:Podospora anserina S mat+ genomic DNA chromosome 6, supercontig 2 n=1 Tax=Podospora anserina (strain S / ATCC MYA-4624 / DSM 980 / FGSC 10383) TaxID=515849 RepID=B2B384_PODAN|nr:uncharacterized protein PODANS_6_765 [Podospora anserina S mat+]CAP71570.1 unnamed protein product [Podospora anserina S mat+]CDP30966.1 Putative protein of unknown function [Podospora anserina S mat+]
MNDEKFYHERANNHALTPTKTTIMTVLPEMARMTLGNLQLTDGIYFTMTPNAFTKPEEKPEWRLYFAIRCLNGTPVSDLIREGFHWSRKNIITSDTIYYYDEKNSCQRRFWHLREFADEPPSHSRWIMQIAFQSAKLETCAKFCLDDTTPHHRKIQHAFAMPRTDTATPSSCTPVTSPTLLSSTACWRMRGRTRT